MFERSSQPHIAFTEITDDSIERTGTEANRIDHESDS